MSCTASTVSIMSYVGSSGRPPPGLLGFSHAMLTCPKPFSSCLPRAKQHIDARSCHLWPFARDAAMGTQQCKGGSVSMTRLLAAESRDCCAMSYPWKVEFGYAAASVNSASPALNTEHSISKKPCGKTTIKRTIMSWSAVWHHNVLQPTHAVAYVPGSIKQRSAHPQPTSATLMPACSFLCISGICSARRLMRKCRIQVPNDLRTRRMKCLREYMTSWLFKHNGSLTKFAGATHTCMCRRLHPRLSGRPCRHSSSLGQS